MSETGRKLTVCGQTMAPVKLEFPASVKALLRNGELTVYDILELVVNGVNALCGSYDSNMGSLEGWTDGVAEWANDTGEALEKKVDDDLDKYKDKKDQEIKDALHDAEDEIDKWKEESYAVLFGVASNHTFAAQSIKKGLLTIDVQQVINGAFMSGRLETCGYKVGKYDKKLVLESRYGNKYETGSLTDLIDSLPINRSGGLTANEKAELERAQQGFSSVSVKSTRPDADGNVENYLYFSNSKGSNTASIMLKDMGIGALIEDANTKISSVSVMQDGELLILTDDGDEHRAHIPLACEMDYDDEKYGSDEVGGLMTVAESWKLEKALTSIPMANDKSLGGVKVKSGSGLKVDGNGYLSTGLKEMGLTIDTAAKKMYYTDGDGNKYALSMTLVQAASADAATKYVFVGESATAAFDANALVDNDSYRVTLKSGQTANYECKSQYLVVLVPTTAATVKVCTTGSFGEEITQDMTVAAQTVSGENDVMYKVYSYRMAVVNSGNPQGYSVKITF